MQAGRELDAKVAEALGYKRGTNGAYVNGEVINGYFIGDRWFSDFPNFYTDWADMGVLVEEARQQGIHLEFSHGLKGGYYGYSGTFVDGEYQTDHETENAVSTAPHAICLVFLQAKGIAT